MATIQFKITLRESAPKVWRRFKVSDQYRMDRFHQVIQIVMGWQNSHLHEFLRVEDDERIGMVLDDIPDAREEIRDETEIYLKELELEEGDKFIYLYDLGDDWHHLLKVEKIEERDIDLPVCIEGDGACPPEDVGGIGGYKGFLNILEDPEHDEYQQWSDWAGADFDPLQFSVEEVNEELERFGKWHNKNPKAKSTPWHDIS